jgi:hypothetical protein
MDLSIGESGEVGQDKLRMASAMSQGPSDCNDDCGRASRWSFDRCSNNQNGGECGSARRSWARLTSR